MTSAEAATDARLGLLAAFAYDMYPGPGSSLLRPFTDARIPAAGWDLCGYITGVDAVMRPANGTKAAIQTGDRVFYGFLAQSTANPGEFVVAIRGTDGILEWLDDAEFSLITRADGAHVEAGFNGIYETMEYLPLVGDARPAADGIAATVGSGTITVVGHSLGAALATYLALDLARNEHLPVTGRFFASPHPGDHAFSDLFATWVHDARAYAYSLDIVPRVPVGLGYSPLDCLVEISHHTAQAQIKFSLACFHHVWCYAACLDDSVLNSSLILKIDQTLTACILGPRS